MKRIVICAFTVIALCSLGISSWGSVPWADEEIFNKPVDPRIPYTAEIMLQDSRSNTIADGARDKYWRVVVELPGLGVVNWGQAQSGFMDLTQAYYGLIKNVFGDRKAKDARVILRNRIRIYPASKIKEAFGDIEFCIPNRFDLPDDCDISREDMSDFLTVEDNLLFSDTCTKYDDGYRWEVKRTGFNKSSLEFEAFRNTISNDADEWTIAAVECEVHGSATDYEDLIDCTLVDFVQLPFCQYLVNKDDEEYVKYNSNNVAMDKPLCPSVVGEAAGTLVGDAEEGEGGGGSAPKCRKSPFEDKNIQKGYMKLSDSPSFRVNVPFKTTSFTITENDIDVYVSKDGGTEYALLADVQGQEGYPTSSKLKTKSRVTWPFSWSTKLQFNALFPEDIMGLSSYVFKFVLKQRDDSCEEVSMIADLNDLCDAEQFDFCAPALDEPPQEEEPPEEPVETPPENPIDDISFSVECDADEATALVYKVSATDEKLTDLDLENFGIVEIVDGDAEALADVIRSSLGTETDTSITLSVEHATVPEPDSSFRVQVSYHDAADETWHSEKIDICNKCALSRDVKKKLCPGYYIPPKDGDAGDDLEKPTSTLTEDEPDVDLANVFGSSGDENLDASFVDGLKQKLNAGSGCSLVENTVSSGLGMWWIITLGMLMPLALVRIRRKK